jgi:large subunit ribosomal protein L25
MSLDISISLEAKNRTERGKNEARRLRAQGLVPVTVYGGGLETASTTVVHREFSTLLRTYGRNKIFMLNFNGASTPVKIAELQVDRVKGNLLHADLMRISLTEKTTFELTIKITGEPEAVKTFGGIIEVVTHSLEVRCLPADLPESIEFDVSALNIGDHINVKDLAVSEKIEVLTDPEAVVATILAPRIEEEVEPVAEPAAEPEVIKKGKAEEEEEKEKEKDKDKDKDKDK